MHEHFVGTKPVDERLRFDVDRLARYLRENVESFSGALDVQQFSGGQSNPTFMLQAGNKRFVLRRKPPGKLLPSAHAVDREFRVISALHQTEVPVARPYCLCEDDSVIGTAFYIMDYVEGRVLWDGSLPDLSVEQRHAIYNELNHVMAAFGPSRVMAGSNWPPILLGGGFKEVWEGQIDLIAGCSATEKAEILGGTAERVYRL